MKWLLDAITHKGSIISQKEQLWRLIIHLPVGGFIGYCCWLGWQYGIAFLVLFVLYEWDEGLWLRDRMWIDLRGSMWGLAIGVIIVHLLNLP